MDEKQFLTSRSKIQHFKRALVLSLLALTIGASIMAGLSGGNAAGPQIAAAAAGTPTNTPKFTRTPTNTKKPTRTLTKTITPTQTLTPAVTATPKPTNTPVSAQCQITSEGLPNLIDLGSGTWQGYQGGLWLNGSNSIPSSYQQIGLQHSAKITPRDSNGNPAPDGKIVLLSIGMSNAQQDYNYFVQTEVTDTLKSPAVALINGAQANFGTADLIIDPNASYWTYVENQLTSYNSTDYQVQAIWIKETIDYNRNPIVPFPTDALNLQSDLQQIVSILEGKFPNLQIIYLSSRTYAGYSSVKTSPEPSAHDSGFAVKWLIQDRVNGVTSGTSWLTWGPYMWADGLNARSDGLQWLCSDFDQTDGTHPSTSGKQKVYGMLMNTWLNDPTANVWYLASLPTPTPTSTGRIP